MLIRKKLITINLLSFFIISLAHGTIYKNISKFSKVEEYCKKAIEQYKDKNILIAWDVDETLLQQTSSLFFYNNIYIDRFFDELESIVEKEGKNTYIKVYSSYMENEPLVAIDDNMSKFINLLQQKKNVKNIAITATLWDSFGQIKNTKKWRANQLKKVGIDFSQSFPIMPPISLHIEKGPIETTPTILSHFDNGILYTGTTAKGMALSLLLHVLKKDINWQPALIIFIDDREQNVENVHTICTMDKDINCLGLHVAFEKKTPQKLDKEVAEFQINYFIKNRTWIPDQKAKELHKNKF